MRRRALLAALLGAPALAWPAPPKSEPWTRWARHDANAPRVLNHSLWAAFLARYVVTRDDGDTRVRYAQVSHDDAGLLRVYLDELQRTPVSTLRREEQRAYWINLYNAQTVKLVLDRYPLPSILAIEISPGWFAKGPWGARMLKVEDETLSLDDIEHRILRPLWNDARTHYALCRAMAGDAGLAAEPFTGANGETLLDAGARAFINSGRALRFDGARLFAAQRYRDFRDDFGGSEAAVLAHLRRYAQPALETALGGIHAIAGYDAPDVRLNDAELPGTDADSAPVAG